MYFPAAYLAKVPKCKQKVMIWDSNAEMMYEIEWQDWFFTQSGFLFSHCSKSSFFVQKFNFNFPRKLSIFLGWKTRENVVVLEFLAADNFDFTRKIVKKNLDEKLVKMLGYCQNWILDKKWRFWTVCTNIYLEKKLSICNIL